ncbi:hypothetical protein [Luteimonas sp. 3794]|uniref:hypothetical protein n=1 Tax=Luteimonas sp. 3794 TaxID=2817730 RepID=UPI00285CA565|nr:hypothetical protein [Luteimonas sp. 3794]MDR6991376.1 hypothetical protein [Luteimonas sp. 3794]
MHSFNLKTHLPALALGLALLTNAPDARADDRLIEPMHAAVQALAAAYFARSALVDACGPLPAPIGPDAQRAYAAWQTRNEGALQIALSWMTRVEDLLDAHGIEGSRREFVEGRNAMIVEEAHALRDRDFPEGIADIPKCIAAAARIDARYLDLDARSESGRVLTSPQTAAAAAALAAAAAALDD